jgi:hypothetical protein
MPAVTDNFWLHRGYEALTFFGFIVTHSDTEARHFNSHYDELKNHEMIHLRQAQATGDSWWRFYALYLWYWLRGLAMNRRMARAAYLLNPFELEAYRHMHDLHYPERCAAQGGAREWRRFTGMDYSQRRSVYDAMHGKKGTAGYHDTPKQPYSKET